MKLEKLLTLSQFIEMVSKERPFILGFDQECGMSELADNYVAIFDYNDFLKQPLTKEMFINPYQKPNKPKQDDDLGLISAIQDQKLGKYLEAEKKIIFDGWKLRLWNDCILFDNDELDIFIDFDDYHTIYELAEDFSGELNLKNVEL